MNLRLPLTAAVPVSVTTVRDAGDWFMIGCAVLSVALALISVLLQIRDMRRTGQPTAPERPSDVEPGVPPRLIEFHGHIPPDAIMGCMNCCWGCPRRSWPPVTRPGCRR